jgi:hypothetical protein
VCIRNEAKVKLCSSEGLPNQARMEESEAWGNAAWMDVQIRSSWRSVHEAWTMEQRSNDAAAKDAQM